MRYAVALVCAVLAVGLPAGPVRAGEPSVVAPRWSRGDSWTVKTDYARLTLGRRHQPAPPTDEVMDEAVFWVFRVTKVAERDGVRLVRMQVRDRDGGKTEVASLTFAQPFGTDGPRGRLSMISARFLRGDRDGTPLTTELDMGAPGGEPSPAITEGTVIPFDAPVLPLGGTSSVDATIASTAAFPRCVAFELFPRTVETGEGGLRYALDVEQREFADADPDAFIGRGTKAALTGAGWPATGYVGVELSRPFDRKLVRQLWHPTLPWPVATAGGWYRSTLVSSTPAKEPGR